MMDESGIMMVRALLAFGGVFAMAWGLATALEGISREDGEAADAAERAEMERMTAQLDRIAEARASAGVSNFTTTYGPVCCRCIPGIGSPAYDCRVHGLDGRKYEWVEVTTTADGGVRRYLGTVRR